MANDVPQISQAVERYCDLHIDRATIVLLFLTPLITVIIWVAIWNPFDVLLYNRWGEIRTIQIYSCMRTMAIRVSTG